MGNQCEGVFADRLAKHAGVALIYYRSGLEVNLKGRQAMFFTGNITAWVK